MTMLIADDNGTNSITFTAADAGQSTRHLSWAELEIADTFVARITQTSSTFCRPFQR